MSFDTYHVSLPVMYLVITTKEDACNVVLYCLFSYFSSNALYSCAPDQRTACSVIYIHVSLQHKQHISTIIKRQDQTLQLERSSITALC
jgi:hypothetical protein